jgi:hypothetical protein
MFSNACMMLPYNKVVPFNGMEVSSLMALGARAFDTPAPAASSDAIGGDSAAGEIDLSAASSDAIGVAGVSASASGVSEVATIGAIDAVSAFVAIGGAGVSEVATIGATAFEGLAFVIIVDDNFAHAFARLYSSFCIGGFISGFIC